MDCSTRNMHLKRPQQHDDFDIGNNKRRRRERPAVSHNTTKYLCPAQYSLPPRSQKECELAGDLALTAATAKHVYSPYILPALRCITQPWRSPRPSVTPSVAVPINNELTSRAGIQNTTCLQQASLVTSSTPDFEILGALSQTAVMAGAWDSTYIPTDPPRKPVLLPLSQTRDQSNIPHAPRTAQNASPTNDGQSGSRISDLDKSFILEYIERITAELKEPVSSITPGIPADYAEDFHEPYCFYTPKKIWLLRHLKPKRRQEVHEEFRKRSEQLLLHEFDSKESWDIWAVIKSASSQLFQQEREYYRLHKESIFMSEEQRIGKPPLPWKTLVKCQSFDTRIDENGTVQRLRRASLLKNITSSSKHGGEDGGHFSSPAVSVGSVLGEAISTTCRKRPGEDLREIDPKEQPNKSKKPRLDDIEHRAGQNEDYNDSTENSLAPIDPRAAAKHAIEQDEQRVYQEYRHEIENIWARDRSRPKNALFWQKVSTWQAWRLANKKPPVPTLTMEQALNHFDAGPLQAAAQTPIPQHHPHAVAQPAPQIQDYEDPTDETTWARFPGTTDRYHCAHRDFKCVDGACERRDHGCCVNGMTLKQKRESVKRQLRKNERPTAGKKQAQKTNNEQAAKSDQRHTQRAAQKANLTDQPLPKPLPASTSQPQNSPPSAPFSNFVHKQATVPYSDATPPTHSHHPPATKPPVSLAIHHSGQAAEQLELKRPPAIQHRDACTRGSRTHPLTPEERTSSIERRTVSTTQATSGDGATGSETGDGAVMSDADIDALFEDDGAEW